MNKNAIFLSIFVVCCLFLTSCTTANKVPEVVETAEAEEAENKQMSQIIVEEPKDNKITIEADEIVVENVKLLEGLTSTEEAENVEEVEAPTKAKSLEIIYPETLEVSTEDTVEDAIKEVEDSVEEIVEDSGGENLTNPLTEREADIIEKTATSL